ncbi:ferredoxin [Nesterenkonia sp. E16_7]|uniref:4Fe-4S domain-containing protein n=1 Tax=unclassified Nesterenkonia TaxID=2629769 RepID=UPI001A91162B|nr:ferredoxin [Nesterenkonia sp. E16_10]MBO0597708.1 ferredoxin [Nesterenkonia sp. E16_7]
MKIATTEDTCVAAGQCVRSAPNVFAQRADDGKVELLKEIPSEAEHDLVREAADFCPSASIHIEE